VREVIAAISRVSGVTLPVKESPRRPGDPPSLIADSRLIRTTLGWTSQYDNLDEIVATAYAWEKRLNSV
jgi:UDP-glucose 4-epimerase